MDSSFFRLRLDLLELSLKHQAHHLGSCLSCLDLLWQLYDRVLGQDDEFILSKGHAAMALYLVLAEKKLIDKKDLFDHFGKDGGIFLGHPSTRHLKNITWSTGALGQGLGVAAGRSFYKKYYRRQGNVFVLVSDGELNCGSSWEAIALAGAQKLSSLVLLVDLNGLQGIGEDAEVFNVGERILEKFQCFNWQAILIDGHAPEVLERAIATKEGDKPLVIIARTVKGKGLPSIENKVACHYQHATQPMIEEFKQLYETKLF